MSSSPAHVHRIGMPYNNSMSAFGAILDIMTEKCELRYRTLRVHPHFLWSKRKIGPSDFALLHPYDVPGIGSTQSEGEPHYET
jgi:hypothetical protein